MSDPVRGAVPVVPVADVPVVAAVPGVPVAPAGAAVSGVPVAPAGAAAAESPAAHAPSIAELTQLRTQLETMRITFDAVREGGVDGIMVGAPHNERLHAFTYADRPYRAIVEEMGEGAATVSERGVVLYANRRFAELLDNQPDKLIGTAVAHLVDRVNRPHLQQLLSAAAGDTNRGELALVRRDSSTVDVLVSATGLDVEGVLVRCLIATDLTDRKRIEEELARRTVEVERANAAFVKTNARLERSNRELQLYASAISHDLREPLRTTAGFANLIGNRYAADMPESARDLLGFVERGTQRMDDRITTMLEYARSGADTAPARPMDSDAVARAAVLDITGLAEKTGAHIRIGELPVVVADALQIERVLQNLLTNAVLHCEPGVTPEISIDAERRTDHWQFAVTDNGIGVPVNSRKRIFDMFVRGKSAPGVVGHGMGLSLCRRIIESYGGTIWVEDNPAGGSRFCFTLPAVASS